METIRVTLDLPADFVQEAEPFGLLETKALQDLLREELDRRVMAFVNDEIKSYRKHKRDQSTSQRSEA